MSAITSADEAVKFLTAQGFEIKHVDGIYRVRKRDWKKRPNEVNEKVLIEQANYLKKHNWLV